MGQCSASNATRRPDVVYCAQNLAVSTVATAPSPATSGTSVIVATGEGVWFADPAVVGPYPATFWADGALPTQANAEIVLVTAKSTDTLTIVRAQEGTSARTVVVGDQVAATITAAWVAGRDALTNLSLILSGVR
jgi:hypothetical protein